ncbi:leucine rich repeat gene family [Mythimna separata entomopoxvirus 'L']|uniref:Leucine rich repeat gene family n=1 Tax=Mythimna separata entomopoxvirus 'L' TaxID=1293572 RepID=A0A916KQ15_9POXV|nr:leucine rich repeat gene family [Mythimna separata entomopoxvirus 'L']CCU56227.1 leucine rich repeat gene family [Mythimna separata entomopoxvirus 'L']
MGSVINFDKLLLKCGDIDIYSKINLILTSAKEYFKNLLNKTEEYITYSDAENIIEFDIINKLYITEIDIVDINILSSLKNLKELHILYNNESIFFNIPYNIEILIIQSLNIIDLSFLHNFKNITKLDISNNKNSNISEITWKYIDNLTYLNCSSCNIQNYEFIKNLINLKTLVISSNIGNNLENIITNNIEELIMESLDIADYSFIEKLINLKILNIAFNKADKNNLHLINLPHTLEYLDDYETYKENYDFLKKLPNLIEYKFYENESSNPIKISMLNLNIYYKLEYIDLQGCHVDTDLLLSHTKLKRISIDLNYTNTEIIIDLPISVERVRILNNKCINNYIFLKELINLKRLKIVNSYINSLHISNDIENISLDSCKSKYNCNFKFLENKQNLYKLKLGMDKLYNINNISLPINIQYIVINNIEMLKNIKYLEYMNNLEYIEISNNIYSDDNIIIDLRNTYIKTFKVIFMYQNTIKIYLPNTIENIIYLNYNRDNFIWKPYKNLKKIKTLKKHKQMVNNIYKNANIEIEIF